MGRKIVVEFEIAYPDLSFQKDIDLIEDILLKRPIDFTSAKIIKPQEYSCRTAYEIRECIERNNQKNRH